MKKPTEQFYLAVISVILKLEVIKLAWMARDHAVLFHRAKTEMKDCHNSVWEKGAEIQTEVLVMSWDASSLEN